MPMDKMNLDASPTPPAETDAERSRRIAQEAQGIAEARAQVAAGFYVDSAEIRVWIDSIGTDNELPPPSPVPLTGWHRPYGEKARSGSSSSCHGVIINIIVRIRNNIAEGFEK